jgi:hypothetical protein
LCYLLLTDFGEPESYEEEMQVNTKNKSKQGMKEEIYSLVNNQTWDLVQFPAGNRALQNKWFCSLKEEDGEKGRYKARLVVKVFEKNKCIYFDGIFLLLLKLFQLGLF